MAEQLSQAGVMVLYEASPAAKISQAGVMVLYEAEPPIPTRLAQAGVMVLYQRTLIPGRLAQAGVMVLYERSTTVPLSGITPSAVSAAGGTEVTISGTFVVGNEYTVAVGDNFFYGGFENDNSYTIVATSTDTLTAYSPATTPGGLPSIVTITDLTSDSVGTDTLQFDPETRATTVYGLRRSAGGLPRKVGPTGIDDEPSS